MTGVILVRLGSNKQLMVNASYIVSAQLTKGKTTAFVKGTSAGDDIQVSELSIREPWTIVLKTTLDTYYLNYADIDKAIDMMTTIIGAIQNIKTEEWKTLRKEMVRIYEQIKDA